MKLRQTVEYDRQRTEEDRRLAPTPSREWGVLAVLFWTVLPGIVLWNAPFLPWVGILKLAGLMIGLAVLCGAASVVTAHLTLVDAKRPQRSRKLSAAPARATATRSSASRGAEAGQAIATVSTRPRRSSASPDNRRCRSPRSRPASSPRLRILEPRRWRGRSRSRRARQR
jgi:hypothetical protein